MPEGAFNPLNGLVSTWPGNDGTQTITNGIDLVNNDGLVWIKNRGPGTAWHELYDTLRGPEKVIYSNDSGINTDQPNGLTAFNENGFTLGSGGGVNGSGSNIVGWTFAKQEGFFDVVKQNVGNGDTVINHSLGRNPTFIIGKDIALPPWYCWHVGIPESQYLALDEGEQVQDGNVYSLINDNSFTLKVANATGVAGEWVFYIFASNPDTASSVALTTAPAQLRSRSIVALLLNG